MSRYAAIVFLLLLVSGCATTHTGIERRMYDAFDDDRSVLVKSPKYDDHGLPLFQRFMDRVPGREGDRFTLVRFSSGRPIESYDIKVEKQDSADFGRPMKTIYGWSAAGFTLGAGLGLSILGAADCPENDPDCKSDEVVKAAVTLAVGSVVVCTVGGFMIGVGESVPEFGEEFNRSSTDTRLVIISYSSYLYDRMGRLITVLEYAPQYELVTKRTEYHYELEEIFPYKMQCLDRWGNVMETAEYRE